MGDHTHTTTYTVIEFADPFKMCERCDGWVTGVAVFPDEFRASENLPCRHAGYRSVCPSWSPVDGCQCVEHLGHVAHLAPPAVLDKGEPTAVRTEIVMADDGEPMIRVLDNGAAGHRRRHR